MYSMRKWTILLLLEGVVAWVATTTCTFRAHDHSSSRLTAKPPPVSNFDLDAIEAFELELDLLDAKPGGDFSSEEDSEDDDLLETDDVQVITVPPELHQKRIDAALSQLLDNSPSRSSCGSLVTDGCVFVVTENGNELVDRKSFKVVQGQELRVRLPPPQDPTELLRAEKLALDVLFEDEHMIVLNKAAGMVVHPAAGNWHGTVVNALMYYLQHDSPFGTGEYFDAESKLLPDDEDVSLRPGIVHRLDKGTTGILVVGKTAQAVATLSQQFADRTVQKTYLAITVGNPGQRVVIDKPIGRHPIHRQRMRVVPDPRQKDSSGMSPRERASLPTTNKGRRALSLVDTLAFDGKLSLVRVRIETGRTHQIRVHLEDRHTPIYGDDVYGLSDWNKRLEKQHQITRPLLHAYQLKLEHPVTGEPLVFQAPMASDMEKLARNIYPQGEEEMPMAFGTVA